LIAKELEGSDVMTLHFVGSTSAETDAIANASSGPTRSSAVMPSKIKKRCGVGCSWRALSARAPHAAR